MTSEIRANTIKNRVGLGTVSFTNTGTVVSGIVTSNTLRLPDATSGSLGRLQLGNGLHLSLYHNGSNSFLVNNNGYLSIQSQAGVNGIFIARNAEVNLYFGSSVRLQTSSSGVTINRDLDVDGHTNLDNVSISGVTTSGHLTINGDLTVNDNYPSIHLKDYDSDSDFMLQNQNGVFTVYDVTNNADRFEILSNGTVRSPHYTLQSTSPSLTFNDTNHDSDYMWQNANGLFKIYDNTNGADRFAVNSSGSVFVYGNELYIGDSIIHNGDANTKIRFPSADTITFETGGTERVRINSNGLTVPDGDVNNNYISAGNSQDIKIFHDGSHSYIRDIGTGGLRITTNSFNVLNSSNGESMITGTEDGAVKLYYDHNLRLETSGSRTIFRGSGGIGVYGDAGSNQNGQISLHPTGSAVYTNLFFYNAAGNSYASIVGHDGGTLFFTGGTNGPLRHRVNGTGFHSFQDGNTQRVTITAGGSVNIGSDFTQTTYKLKVTGTSYLNGVVRVPNGSAAAPAIHFGDSDSGLYGDSSNGVRITAGGSDRIVATANGVTFPPQATALTSFTLGSQSALSKPLYFADSASVQSASILLDNSSQELRIKNGRFSGQITFTTYNTEKLRIESGGEIRLTSENGNNSDTPGFTFRGGSSSQKANFARIHSRMVSNWGGQLQFKVKDDNGSLSDAYRTAMIMNHNAYVTKPEHPAFFATHSGTDGSTSDGNLIELTTTRYNKNDVYSTSSYYFTAPVAGVYTFTGQVWAKNGSNHARWQFSYHNGSSWSSITQHGFHGNGVNKNDFMQNASITYYMNSGDRMGMRVDNGPLAYYRGGGGAAHTYFCGHLVG